MKLNKKILSVISCMLLALTAFAQTQTAEPEMADLMRSNGKIYVVVGCILLIFAGIIIYLISLDKKLGKLKKKLGD
jgi:hypothetical protein